MNRGLLTGAVLVATSLTALEARSQPAPTPKVAPPAVADVLDLAVLTDDKLSRIEVRVD